jgi:hypothetical protein
LTIPLNNKKNKKKKLLRLFFFYKILHQMPKGKKPVWDHFDIIGKYDNPHPNVRCKYCQKKTFQRAVPRRMQTHLDKCIVAPSIAKSPELRNTTSNYHGDHMSIEEQKYLEFLLDKACRILNSRSESPIGYFQQNNYEVEQISYINDNQLHFV